MSSVVVSGSGNRDCRTQRDATLEYRLIRRTDKLVTVQDERKDGRERICPYHNIRGLDHVRSRYDSGERDKEIDDRPRFQVSRSVSYHDRGSINVPALDDDRFPSGDGKRRLPVEARVRAL